MSSLRHFSVANYHARCFSGFKIKRESCLRFFKNFSNVCVAFKALIGFANDSLKSLKKFSFSKKLGKVFVSWGVRHVTKCV